MPGYLERAILNSRRFGLRIIHFSLLHNHIHLIVEADSNEILTRGMRSFTVTFAKRIQQGRVQLERYHLHVLKSIRETKNAIKYVPFNNQRHGSIIIDEYSSLLHVSNAVAMIKAFAKEKKVSLKIKEGNPSVPLSLPQSYFAQIFFG